MHCSKEVKTLGIGHFSNFDSTHNSQAFKYVAYIEAKHFSEVLDFNKEVKKFLTPPNGVSIT